ncbi:MAG: hypothetical protein V4476_04930 [Pseudomonadota bacterium]
MPSLGDVYRKFGEVSEAAQLLETQLGTMLLKHGCLEADLFTSPDPVKAAEIYKWINKVTLGQLIKRLGQRTSSIVHVEELLQNALAVRNRLAHSFYLRHNLRRNSEDGREIMLKDLESMHDELLEAYKAVMVLSGIDIDKLVAEQGDASMPTGHLPI